MPQHPAFLLKSHLPTFFQAAVFSPLPSPPLQQFIVQVPQLTEKRRPKRKPWEDTVILLRPWGQISNETHQRRTCRRDGIWLPPDPPQAKSRLASPWRATGLGPGAGCLPSRLSLPLAGLFLSPPSEQPSLPSPSKLPGSHILSSWKPDSLFPLLSPLPPSLPSPGSSASPSPEGALATRVLACSSPWAPAPLCAKEAPLQLSQFPSYKEVGYKSLSPRLA